MLLLLLRLPSWQTGDEYGQEGHLGHQMLQSMRRRKQHRRLRMPQEAGFVKLQIGLPMSMGVWALLSFSLFNGITAIIQVAKDGLIGKWWGARLLAALPQKLLALPGSGFAFFIGGYAGVLLTATSVPLWSRSKLLGAIFLSSALSSSTALISLAVRLVGAPGRTLQKLEKLQWTALFVEIIGLLAFLRSTGRAARPLVGTGPNEHGHTFWRFEFGF